MKDGNENNVIKASKEIENLYFFSKNNSDTRIIPDPTKLKNE
jgi:hypothetical protein